VAEHWPVFPVGTLVEGQETLTEVIVGGTTMVPPPPPQPANKKDDKETMTTSQPSQPQGFPEPKARTKVTIAASLLETQFSQATQLHGSTGGANPLYMDEA
jgi:hypothetical protein